MSKINFLKSSLHAITSEILNHKKAKILFLLFLCILLTDKIYGVIYFGFTYTDIDQVIMWNGAVDYSHGIFHEPFFYGQAYNYMLEAFLAVPLLWMNIPVYYALPIVTSAISLLPFIALGIILFRNKKYFWAYCSLLLPVLLPIEYNFLTTLSRGFIQAHFFVPFLFIPLFSPEKPRSVIILFVASALSFIANQSAIIIIIPIGLYVFTYHYRSIKFYLKALLMLPFLYLDHLAKQFYISHPERVVHKIEGLEIDSETFLNSISSTDHFDFLFPFFPYWGILYFACFSGLLGIAIYNFRTKKKSIIFICSGIVLILLTFTIPKVQEPFPVPASIFFTPSRLYLFLPILLLIAGIMVFKEIKNKSIWATVLVFIGVTTVFYKNNDIENKIEKITENTDFPIAKNEDIIQRVASIEELRKKHDLDLILNTTSLSWFFIFDAYAYYPLTQNSDVTSIIVNGDRRTWQFNSSKNGKNILLNGFNIDSTLMHDINYTVLNIDQIIIHNNKQNVHELLKSMNIHYGTLPY